MHDCYIVEDFWSGLCWHPGASNQLRRISEQFMLRMEQIELTIIFSETFRKFCMPFLCVCVEGKKLTNLLQRNSTVAFLNLAMTEDTQMFQC